MTIAQVGTTTSANATSATPTVNKPTGTASGHIVILSISVNGGAMTTGPSGFTNIYTTSAGLTNPKMYVYYRICDGTEGTTFSCTLSASLAHSIQATTYSGVDNTTPFETTLAATEYTATTTNMVAPTILAGATGRCIIGGASGNSSTTTFTVPTSPSAWTELYDAGAGKAHDYAHLLNASSSSVNPTFVQSAARAGVAWDAALAVASTGPQTVSCNVLTTSTTLFDPTIIPPPQSVAFTLISATETVLNAGIEAIISMDVTGTTTTLFNPTLDYNVDLSVITTTSNLMQPELAHRADLDFLATSTTLYGPDLNQDLNIPVLSVPETMFNPTVPSSGVQTINYQVLDVPTTLFSPSAFQTIAVPVLNVPGTVESPSLIHKVEIPTIATSTSIFTPSLDYLIELQTINTSPTVLAPRVGPAPTDTGQYGIVKTNSPSSFPIGL